MEAGTTNDSADSESKKGVVERKYPCHPQWSARRQSTVISTSDRLLGSEFLATLRIRSHGNHSHLYFL